MTSSTAARRFRPLVACVLALLLAGAGEAVIRTGGSFWLSLVLYIAAAAVFVPGAFLPPASAGEPEPLEGAQLPRAVRAGRGERDQEWLRLGARCALQHRARELGALLGPGTTNTTCLAPGSCE